MDFKNKDVARLLDANGNRARERLRVMEDYARFVLNDAGVAGETKTLRHELAEVGKLLGLEEAILCRDTGEDVGRENTTSGEFERAGLGDVVIAAGKRLSEALRVMEEVGKIVSAEGAGRVERMRYRGYEIEQMLVRMVGQREGRAGGRFAGTGVYVLLTESLCKGEWKGTLRAVLEGGAKGVQLREKGLEDGELMARARVVVEECRRFGAVAIVNDRVDVAMMAGADGVHVGQTDLPCAEVRKQVGRDFVIGVSTERMEQARQAVRDGASYVAVGPMFATTTKEKPRVAGAAYAREVVGEVRLPVVAIGGISLGNVAELTAVGVRWVAVCSAVIGVEDAKGAVEKILAALGE